MTLGGLTDPGRLLVALLAVFRHPVDLLDDRLIEASMAVEGRYDVIGGIDELRRRQLVEHAARAALHPLVRDHVYATLAGDTGRRRNLHRLAAAHCEQVLTDPLEASWHYARAGEPAEAADLLVASVPELTLGGRCARAADLAGELLGGGQLGPSGSGAGPPGAAPAAPFSHGLSRPVGVSARSANPLAGAHM